MADQATNLYEVLYIVANKYTENEVPKIMESVHQLAQKYNGTIKKEVNYGKRRLAYPIKHNHYGYYILNHIELDTAASKQLNNELRLHEDILRHLISIALPEGSVPEESDLTQKATPTHQPASSETTDKKPSITDTKATDKEKEKMKKGTSFDIEKELGVTAEEAAKELAERDNLKEAQSTESVDMDGLDKKLAEIMSDIDEPESSNKQDS